MSITSKHKHWNDVGDVTFCRHSEGWEFYTKDQETGTIRLLEYKKLRGFGRAKAHARKLNKIQERMKGDI